MKRTAILLCTLLVVAGFAHADSISLTSGSGTLYPYANFPIFSFQFHGSGYNISIPTGLDLPGGQLVMCGPCDPLTLASFPPLFIAAGVLVNGDPYLEGGFEFTAVSFVSSIAPSGIMTIKYTATVLINLFLIDAATDLPIAGPFVWGSSEPWLITAQFVHYPFGTSYKFEGATLTSVPEPATITLLGTGTLPILFGLRRRLSRTSFRTKKV